MSLRLLEAYSSRLLTPWMVDLTLQCACNHPSLGKDGFSFPILPTSPWMQTIVGLFLFPFREGARWGIFGFFLRERANRCCLCFFRYHCFSSSDEHPSRPEALQSFLLWSPLPGKSSLTPALKEETLPAVPNHFVVISRSSKIARLQRRNPEFLFPLWHISPGCIVVPQRYPPWHHLRNQAYWFRFPHCHLHTAAKSHLFCTSGHWREQGC